MNDCSALDHCDHWIFDGAIDLAKTSWGGGSSEVWGGSFPPKRCLDKTLDRRENSMTVYMHTRQVPNRLETLCFMFIVYTSVFFKYYIARFHSNIYAST